MLIYNDRTREINVNTSGNTPHSRAEPVPDLFSVSPALAERAWQRWLADGDPFDGELGKLAIGVLHSIREWGLNIGHEGESAARENLEKRVAMFVAAYAQATNG